MLNCSIALLFTGEFSTFTCKIQFNNILVLETINVYSIFVKYNIFNLKIKNHENKK